MFRVGIRTLVGLVTGLLTLILGAGIAFACSCADLSVEEKADHAEVIARVHVDTMDLPQGDNGLVTYHVTASRVWKGEVPMRFAFVSALHGASCGLEGMHEGHDLLLFARVGTGVPGFDTDGLATNSCSGTTVADAGELALITGLLGEGKVPTDTGDESAAPGEPGLWLAGWGVPAAIALIVVLVAVLVRRQLRRPQP